jgi:hypothetical protein
MQVDPIGLNASNFSIPQSLNLYSYVNNDPVNSTDPTGLFLCAAGNSGCSSGNNAAVSNCAARGGTITLGYDGYGIPVITCTPPRNSGTGAPPSGANPIVVVQQQNARDAILDKSKQNLRDRIENNSECAKLFGGKEHVFQRLGEITFKYEDLGQPTVTYSGSVTSFTHIGASTSADGKIIRINIYGAFESGGTYTAVDSTGKEYKNVPARIPGTDRNYSYSGDDYRLFLLLHELGHATAEKSGFESDRNNDQAGRRNNDKVFNACFK